MTLRFTLRQLEYFVAAGEAGSVALAAERIHVSSPSISAAITQLERELGIRLFVRRHARGLSLTAGGQRMMAQAKRLLDLADAMRCTAGEIAAVPCGSIGIGCMVTLAPFLLPGVRRSFERAYPEIKAGQAEANHLELLRMLRTSQIDIALTYDLETPNDVEFEPLADLPPYALVGAGHRWAGRRSVSLEELRSEPMVLLDLPYSREYFMSLFQENGLRPLVGERAASFATLCSLVANGFGYGLVNARPNTDCALDGMKLASVALKGRFRPMVLGLAVAAGGPKPMAVEAFRGHCRRTISTRSIPGMSPPP